MLRKQSLSLRIVKRVLFITIPLFILTLSGYYFFTRDIIQKSARENAIQLAGKLSGEIEQYLKPLEKIPEMVAESLEMGVFDKDSLPLVLERILEKNPGVFGSSVAFAYDSSESNGFFMPFVYRNGDSINKVFLGGPSYEYQLMDWFQIPFLTEESYWSEPYFDEGGGNRLMTTYSVPFYQHQKRHKVLSGICTIDVDLAWLKDVASGVKIFDSGYAFVLSRNGVALTHPDENIVMNESIFSNADNWDEPLLREIGRDLMKGVSDFREYNLKGKEKRWIYYTPLCTGSWSLAVVYPESEMYAPLAKLNFLLILFVGLGLIVLIVSLAKTIRNMAKPLRVLSDSAKMIAEGTFDAPLPVIHSRDEIFELKNSFSFMQEKLSEYIENLRTTTAAKEKIESELRVAREIQMSMIPKSFPPFPDLPQIDLFAELRPAKEVGGDLYDFFQVGQRKFAFAIGDVSGKGVPASLFMAVTRTLLRSISEKYTNPAEVIFHLNNSLARDNESCMFVTFIFGIIDLEKGELSWVNAGHNPPVYIPPKDTPAFMPSEQSIPLGVREDFAFKENFLSLKTGDKILLYTDGMTEAENAKHELLGDEVVLELIKKHGSLNSKGLITALSDELQNHVKDYHQSDDLTLLSIQFNG